MVEPAVLSSSYSVTQIKRLLYLVWSGLFCRPLIAIQPHKAQNEILGTIKNEKFCFLLHDFKKYILKSTEMERKGFLLKKKLS